MNKPIYKVPSMREIESLPWNGFNAISTFSGCGGSCLGYRMAGYRVLYANEFIPAAQETYKANHPNSYLDKRDIRLVKPEEILDIIGLKKGELDLMDGSPPCAAFSTAGKREAGWGTIKKYSDTKQRVDDLFFEYTRLLNGIQPKVFVAENVSGLIKGTAKGYFIEILKALKACGYNVKCKVLDAQWLGVPQMRQRTIFVGVRNDLGLEPVHPKPLDYQYSVRDALSNIIADGHRENLTPRMTKWYNKTPRGQTLDVGNKILGDSNSGFNKVRLSWDKPSSTILAKSNSGTRDTYHPDIPATPTIAELKRLCAFPDDFILTGSFAQQWERLGRSVPPVMMSHIAKTIQLGILEKL
jgi:DNA (cytosine-5)-methyltransferase 1